ncbi:MAG: hypothetical protein PHE49_10640 [bacterium]|nr:hypothetical protein [bacterium]
MPGHVWRIKEGDYQYRGVDNYSKREKQNLEFTLGAGKYNLGQITFFHRTLADYINPFAKAGLFISKLYEPIPTNEQVKKFPKLAKHQRIPSFMIFEMIKGEKMNCERLETGVLKKTGGQIFHTKYIKGGSNLPKSQQKTQGQESASGGFSTNLTKWTGKQTCHKSLYTSCQKRMSDLPQIKSTNSPV